VEVAVEISGPVASIILSDLGASVIKVEQPGEGDTSRGWGKRFPSGETSAFISFNRNKRSMTLNLKTEEGKEILYRVLEKSDIFIENFRPAVLKGLGIDHKSVKKVNPTIVYVAISGFGLTGPYKNRGSYDLIAQGMSGIMSLTGEQDGPPMPIGFFLADFATSAYTVIAIMAALMMREKTGRGQKIDVSMFDVMTNWMGYQILGYLASGEVATRLGLASHYLGEYGTFKAKDIHFNLCSVTNKHFKSLCQILGIDELADDTRFNSRQMRQMNMAELRAILTKVISNMNGKELLKKLTKAGIPCGPIYDIAELASDPHVRARKMFQKVFCPKVGEIELTPFPVKFSKMALKIKPPPLLGQHTEEILESLGYNQKQINEFKNRGII